MTDAERSTRDRLLDAGTALFAERGYAATSIRHVCDRAGGANVAAVNYHFGSKRGLYDAVLDAARAESNARNPWVALDARRDFWSGEPAETRLRHFVAMLLDHALTDAGGPSALSRILIHEMLDPTEAFDRQADVSIRRVFGALCEICRAVAEGRGCAADEEAVARHALLVSAQCLYPALAAEVFDGLHPGVRFDAAGRAALAETIAWSTIAGLRAVGAGAAGGARPPARVTPDACGGAARHRGGSGGDR